MLEPANAIWCTGIRRDFSWVDLPVFNNPRLHGEPDHERDVVRNEPGLYFVGLFFLHALSSSLLRGVPRDAEHVAEHIRSRMQRSRA